MNISKQVTTVGRIARQGKTIASATSKFAVHYYATKTAKSVLIVGASIEGLTTALALTNKKDGKYISVDIVVEEQKQRYQRPSKSHSGAGSGAQTIVASDGEVDRMVFLPPNATSLLFGLGLKDALLAKGKGMGHLRVMGSRGLTWFTYPLREISKKWFGVPAGFLAIRDEDLRKILWSSIESSRRATIIERDSVKSIKYDEQQQLVQATLRKSRSTRSYDVIVGADGVDSKVREFLFTDRVDQEEEPKFGGSDYFQVNFAKPAEFHILDSQCFEWWGKGKRFGAFAFTDDKGQERILCYGSMRTLAPQGGAMRSSTLTRYLAGSFSGFTGHGFSEIEKMLRRHDTRDVKTDFSSAKVFLAPRDVNASAGAALIGEAGHAISPALWERDAIGIEDAVVLAKHLMREDVDVAGALSAYSNERKPRVKKLNSTSKSIEKLSQFIMPFPLSILRSLFMKATFGLMPKLMMMTAFKPSSKL